MSHPYDHLIVAVDNGLNLGGLQWSSFFHDRAHCCLDTVEHASDISAVRSGLYDFAQLKLKVICAALFGALSVAAGSSESCARFFVGSVFVCQQSLSLGFDNMFHVSSKSVQLVLAGPLFLAESQHRFFVDGPSDKVPTRNCVLSLGIL